MDEAMYKERVKRLKEVNKTIAELDPTIRAEAFDLLRAYVDGSSSRKKKGKEDAGDNEDEVVSQSFDDVEEFAAQFDHDKPADAAKVLAGWHYSKYGKAPFTLAEIRAMADGAGITIPERLDRTFKTSQSGGKKLFINTSRGALKPSVYAEQFFKETYKVQKGTEKKPEAS